MFANAPRITLCGKQGLFLLCLLYIRVMQSYTILLYSVFYFSTCPRQLCWASILLYSYNLSCGSHIHLWEAPAVALLKVTLFVYRIKNVNTSPSLPPSSISCSRLSILARPQSLMNWSCSIICQVMLCRVGSRSKSSPKRPLESYWRSLM